MIFKNVARFLLKRKVKAATRIKRNDHFRFPDVQSVGIVFSADTISQIESIKKYMTTLNNQGKRVSAICFYQSKELPVINHSGLIIDFVLPKEVDFWGAPKPSFIEGFIENDFDLLIDFDINEVFPVEYVSAMSKSLFKVGRHTKINESIFDFMLDIDEAKDINYFIEQTDSYLKMFNKAA